MDQYLFHGIFACAPERDTSNMEAEIIKSILNSKMIASRELLKTLLTEEEYKRIVMTPTENWNGDTHVSVSAHISKVTSFPGHFSGKINHECTPAYTLYIKFKPAIILNCRLLGELPVCQNPVNNMPGEIQIKDKVPSEYFEGILLPYGGSLDLFLDYIWKKHHPKNEWEILDYYRWYTDAEEDLFQLSEEEFVRKYYQKVMLFEEVLKETNSNLKLYQIDGSPILTSTKRLDQIEKLKKKCL